eukprot:CAMPEP_0202347168 /NCGR_PEP_ID=MMETSP1126-20121109/5648_1 /ASSEMBLY_ACC=CAM_ASM_000457 /TAXON_ID=3047 /ORGANISM="Dunaliella tertiolecta, Strain CCMP1320" /LENGTH=811 /DNA_ID=CAMNT_0048938685 /DNA_START=361 /DNA_END=2797 /DNA_ORIENTATION=-
MRSPTRLYSYLFCALLAFSGLFSFLLNIEPQPEPEKPQEKPANSVRPPPFQPAPQAEALWRHVSLTPDLGCCLKGWPAFSGVMPTRACTNLTCVISERGPFSLDTLALVEPKAAKAMRCAPAQGGQRRPRAKQQSLGNSTSAPSAAAADADAGDSSLPDIQVSVVMPVYNNDLLARQALVEVFRTSREADSLELVVVDDGSRKRLAGVECLLQDLEANFGTRCLLLRMPSNKGFGAAVNYGVLKSVGAFVVILNTDAFVIHGWLSAMLRTFELRPDAGLVGPLFIGSNNQITEAGGIVYSDGSAANYGRFFWPHENYTYLRRVDYVSAACVMARRSLFSYVSGLDLSYGRGYYEDTDLAMAVRAHGYHVYMQPLAVVYHQEGSTLGTDESEEKQALMTANRRIFYSKWLPQLSSQHVPPSTSIHRAATQRYKHHILWVDDMIPEPDGDSGSVRMYHLWHVLLSEGFHITFFPNMFRYMHYALMARTHGVHIVLNRTSLVQRGCPYDVIGVSRKPVFAAWQRLLHVLCPKVPIIFDTVDLAFIREGRLALSNNYTMPPSIDSLIATIQAYPQLKQLLDTELQLVRKSSVSLVVSDSEKEVLDRFKTGVPVHIVSNIYEPQGQWFKCEGRRGVLFVGNMAHEPNRQAITFFVDSILPLILKMLTPEEIKAFTFHVVGANLFDKDFPALHKRHVSYYGHVSDEQLRALYLRTRLVVAPLLAGAGVKGKISQAMSFGVPVVATSVAVEGMHLNNGTDCLIADKPALFAAAVLEPYRSCPKWQELSEHGLHHVATYFSKQSAKASLLQVLSTLGVT